MADHPCGTADRPPPRGTRGGRRQRAPVEHGRTVLPRGRAAHCDPPQFLFNSSIAFLRRPLIACSSWRDGGAAARSPLSRSSPSRLFSVSNGAPPRCRPPSPGTRRRSSGVWGRRAEGRSRRTSPRYDASASVSPVGAGDRRRRGQRVDQAAVRQPSTPIPPRPALPTAPSMRSSTPSSHKPGAARRPRGRGSPAGRSRSTIGVRSTMPRAHQDADQTHDPRDRGDPLIGIYCLAEPNLLAPSAAASSPFGA